MILKKKTSECVLCSFITGLRDKTGTKERLSQKVKQYKKIYRPIHSVFYKGTENSSNESLEGDRQ